MHVTISQFKYISLSRVLTHIDLHLLRESRFSVSLDQILRSDYNTSKTSDERTSHGAVFVGRGDGDSFDKNVFLSSREG
jgi:hypothetical protein